MVIKDDRCAPGKEYKDGSCFTFEELNKIADKLEEEKNITLKNRSNKRKLVKELTNHFKNDEKCNDQVCWLSSNYVKNLKDDNILKYTFRPFGPNKRFDWLSNSHIDEVVEQYEKIHNDFMFLGAVPLDFMEIEMLEIHNINFKEKQNQGKNKFGLVINLDTHDKSGSHWTSLFFDLEKYQIYFFDSVGSKPKKLIKKFINKILKYMYKKKFCETINIDKVINELKKKQYKKATNIKNNFDIKYNKIQHQFNNTECGVYSINFILRLVGGETFEEITNNITDDEKINQCRKVYFVNSN
jgi:hypothetical protein